MRSPFKWLGIGFGALVLLSIGVAIGRNGTTDQNTAAIDTTKAPGKNPSTRHTVTPEPPP
jgi:hypothetical protein